MLDRIFGNGMMISLHEANPGERGAPILAGPFLIPLGTYTIRRNKITNVAQIRLDAIDRSGTARYAGFWTRDRDFVSAIPIAAQTVTRGLAIVIAPQQLQLELRAG